MLISISTALQHRSARWSFSTSKKKGGGRRERSSEMTIELFDTLCLYRQVWSGELMVFIIASLFPFHFLYKLAQVTCWIPKRAPRRRPAEPHLLLLPKLLPSLSFSRSVFPFDGFYILFPDTHNCFFWLLSASFKSFEETQFHHSRTFAHANFCRRICCFLHTD